MIPAVGAWSNPFSPDPAERAAAIDTCKAQLLPAERSGARCCVSIAGSRGARWDGAHLITAIDRPRFGVHLGPLGADLPVMLEHLLDATEYALAAAHLRATAPRGVVFSTPSSAVVH